MTTKKKQFVLSALDLMPNYLNSSIVANFSQACTVLRRKFVSSGFSV
jgi:hypothetical protein